MESKQSSFHGHDYTITPQNSLTKCYGWKLSKTQHRFRGSSTLPRFHQKGGFWRTKTGVEFDYPRLYFLSIKAEEHIPSWSTEDVGGNLVAGYVSMFSTRNKNGGSTNYSHSRSYTAFIARDIRLYMPKIPNDAESFYFFNISFKQGKTLIKVSICIRSFCFD